MRRPSTCSVVVCATLLSLGASAVSATASGAEGPGPAPAAPPEKPKNSSTSDSKSAAPQADKQKVADAKKGRAEGNGKPKSKPGTREGTKAAKELAPSRVGDNPDDMGFRVVESDGRAEGVGPGAGAGDRRIRPAERSEPAPEPPPAADSSATRPRKNGPAPKKPRATLPEGSPPGVIDAEARHQIAGGPTAEDLSAAKNDRELRELRDAERVLFPKPLVGARTGWSWDLPTPIDDGAPSVEASGLPAGLPFDSPTASAQSAKESQWLKSLGMPNLPTRLDARVVKYLKFYRDDASGKRILRVWAKRAGRLVPALRAELAKAGLPTDLVWLSLIESGHNPTIVSPAGAAGLWQFIPESARMYGLTVDRWVDQRFDPERSTEAAVRYLSDLRTRFGSWELAMAAYNMGHGGLLRSMKKFNTNDFWVLTRYEAGLPYETTLYVPKILATAIAMANKKAFGIDDVEPDAPLSFDTVEVGPGVDLADVARAAESPVDELRALNAQYLSGRTPPLGGTVKRWPVRVPPGRGLVAGQRLAQAEPRRTGPGDPYMIKFGDTLEAVASAFGVSSRELADRNRVTPDERLRAGNVLFVPRGAGNAEVKAPADDEVVVVPARRFPDGDRRRVFYRVLSADTLADVASAFSVLPSELALWNALDRTANLQQGMTLQVFVPKDADLARVRFLGEHEARVLVAGSDEFFEHFEAQNGRKRITVIAKKGDTLAAIGKRYGMSTGMMERINRLSATTPIREGDTVVVYAKGPLDVRAGPPAQTLASQLSAILAPRPDALPPLAPGSVTPNGTRSVEP
jgi:membrane-bound lytic murein transglycosylase D